MESDMKEFIKELVNEYCNQVKKQTIGCGLSCSDNEKIKKDVEEMIEKLYKEIVGERPNTDTSSPEYTNWYKRTLVFNKIIQSFDGKYAYSYQYYLPPVELETHHGPRD